MEGVGSVVKGLTKYFNTMYVYAHNATLVYTCNMRPQLREQRSI